MRRSIMYCDNYANPYYGGQMPAAPTMPTMPWTPSAPTMPTIPQFPMAPGMPTTPLMPGMMPGMMPAMPTFPVPPETPLQDTAPAPTMPMGPDFILQPGPPVQEDINYTQGFLKTLIGRYVKIDFLIGTNMFIDREGTLVAVGISYLVLREPQTHRLVMCDIYSLKFVNILN